MPYRFMVLGVVVLCMCALPVQAQEVPPEDLIGEVVPADDGAIDPGEFSDQQRDLILLESVVYENAWWSAFDVGASIYDPSRDVLIARWSPALSAGRRFSTYGFFGTLQYDQSLDFTLDVDSLSVLNIGVGAEYLNFLGHVRSSLMVGTSVLLTRTPIDEPGETGWFIELRPGALRWALADNYTLEFSPFALDIIAPVTEGIPLVVYSFSTLIGVEWCMFQ